jgi:acetyl-CoA carboxylase biotin carboxyl carrier protein
MDIKQIQELVKLINKTNIGEITIEENGVKITIKQKKEPSQHFTGTMPTQMFAAPAPAPAAPAPAAVAPAAPVSSAPAPQKTDKLLTIKSPIFVNVGDEIAPGKVVCIIEAMKLFNEIESEISGRIVKVLVDDASPVEYDQPLFLVEPL